MQIFLIAAMTADGYIAENDADVSTRWTSEADSQWFRERTKQAGVMIMGRKTYETIGRPLPKRVSIVYTRQTLPESQGLEKQSDFQSVHPRETSLFSTSLEPQALIAALAQAGCEEVAICGGASIYGAFLAAGVVDRLCLSIEPVIFGRGVRLFQVPAEKKLKLVSHRLLGEQTVLLEYVFT